jgi:hypothetical protein
MSERRIRISKGVVIVLVLGLVLVSLLSIKAAYAEGGQVTLKPTDDTYVDSRNPKSNYGTQNYLQIVNFNNETNSPPESYECLVWLKFNLSSVPDGAVIDVATLQLYTSSVNMSLNVNAYSGADLLNESAIISWTELTMTYSNMPYYNTTSMGSVIVDTVGQGYNWSVADAVRNALSSPATKATIVLFDPTPHGLLQSVTFDSKEFSNSDYAPTLTIHWSEVVPEFPTFLTLPMLMMATLLAVIFYGKNPKPCHKRH